MRTRRFLGIAAATMALLAMPMATVGQDASDEAAGPIFSGWVEPGPAIPGGFAPMWDVDEPRLMGRSTWAANETTVDDVIVRRTTWRIENDDGAWHGDYTKFVPADDVHSGVTAVLVGEGGYDGLVAVVEFDSNQGFGWAVRGTIIEATDVPEVPPAAG